MARLIGKLTDVKVRHVKTPGRYSDGEGLYLQVTRASGGAALNRSWVLRVRVRVLDAQGTLRSHAREMGLGRFPAVGLAEARAKAKSARALAEHGEDPIAAKRAAIRAKLSARQEAALAAARAMTFEHCAEAYVASHKSQWRNAKHAKQWTATLKSYAYPVFGAIAVGDIDVSLVIKVLDPIWTTKAETARRLRGRIEAVLDWATVRGHRSGENPARWKGHLQRALPSRPKASAARHLAALPFDEMGAFMQELRACEGLAARALEFAILTAARTGEVIGARWAEIDLKKAVWTIPAVRMKGAREHRVPLSKPAVALLVDLQAAPGASSDWVFSTQGAGPISNMAMLMLLRRMRRDDLTVHGFRSSFRDWTAERTGFAGEVAEAALAHAVGDKVEAAYRRGDLFEKRRRLMQAWGDHCDTAARPKVVKLRAET
jgi:integrase